MRSLQIAFYTTISTFVLIGCVTTNKTTKHSNDNFLFVSDSLNCQFKDWKDYHPSVFPMDKVMLIDGKRYTPYTSRYNVLNLVDSLLIFQLNDSIFSYNLNSSKSKYITKHSPIYTRNVYGRTSTNLIFRDEYSATPYLISELNHTTNKFPSSRISLHSILSKGPDNNPIFPSQIIEGSNNNFYYTKDYKLFTTDNNFQTIDSIDINTCNFTKASDFQNGVLVYIVNDLYIPDGENEICIYNIESKSRTTISLPFHSDYLTNIVCLKFSKSDPNAIYYIEKRVGLYEFNLKTKVDKKVIEFCPDRNIIDFVVNKTNSKIYAQSENGKIYEIDLQQNENILKILTK